MLKLRWIFLGYSGYELERKVKEYILANPSSAEKDLIRIGRRAIKPLSGLLHYSAYVIDGSVKNTVFQVLRNLGAKEEMFRVYMDDVKLTERNKPLGLYGGVYQSAAIEGLGRMADELDEAKKK